MSVAMATLTTNCRKHLRSDSMARMHVCKSANRGSWAIPTPQQLNFARRWACNWGCEQFRPVPCQLRIRQARAIHVMNQGGKIPQAGSGDRTKVQCGKYKPDAVVPDWWFAVSSGRFINRMNVVWIAFPSDDCFQQIFDITTNFLWNTFTYWINLIVLWLKHSCSLAFYQNTINIKHIM